MDGCPQKGGMKMKSNDRKRKKRGALKKWLKDRLGHLGLQQNPSQAPQTKVSA